MNPVPHARPPGSNISPVYLLAALIALVLAVEYAVLTHPAAPRRPQTEHPSTGKQQAGQGPQTAPEARAKLKNETLPGLGNLGDRLTGGGGLADQAWAVGAQAVNVHVGWLARLAWLVGAVALAFVQSLPVPKPGAPRRLARRPEDVLGPVLGLAVAGAGCGVLLLEMGWAAGPLLTYGYPGCALAALGAGFVAGQLRAATRPPLTRLVADKTKRGGRYGVVLPAEGGAYVNVPNPFRGTLVLGGAGAGKSHSVAEPMLEQLVAKGLCGLIYDFKFPVLAAAAQRALVHAGQLEKPLRHRVVNFVDLTRTEKLNPLRAHDMPVAAYASEYAKTLLANLNPGGAKGGDNFFEKSAEAFLTGIIWFYRNNYPHLCTIPHVVATAVYKDYAHVLSMLATDARAAVLVQSIITSVESKADKQTAGIIASLQIALAQLCTPEISWVLAPDESAGEGFSLNLNHPDHPTVLTIGNDPTLAHTFSPVIACVVAVALKLMNQQHKHPSFVLIDEGATIYVPGLEVIPATARSNSVAMIYVTQDIAQMVDKYGQDKTNVLVSNLNNQFFGKTNSAATARLVSEMIGKEDVEMVSVSAGKSQGGGKAGGGRNLNQSVSYQERQVVRSQDPYLLQQGEFIGQVVETPISFFQAKIVRDDVPDRYPIAPVARFEPAEGIVTAAMRAELAQDRTTTEQTLEELGAQRRQEEDARVARFAAARAAARARRQGSESVGTLEERERPTASAHWSPAPGQGHVPPAMPMPAPDGIKQDEDDNARWQRDAAERQQRGEARLIKQEKVLPEDPQQRLVEANHERIAAEVAHVIAGYENFLDPNHVAEPTRKPTY